MPLVFAFLASAVLHAAALLGSGWVLPGSDEPSPPPTLDAVLARPSARNEPAAEARPVARSSSSKPRPTPTAPPVVATETPAPVIAPASPPPEPPPVAVAPAPTPEPAVPVPTQIALPGKGRMRYEVIRGEGGFVIGQSIHTWEHDGFSYQFKSLTETTGLAAFFKPVQVLQSSQGEVSADGLRPLEFRHERVGGTDSASFDWPNRFVTYAGRRESIVGGTQDMLSMYYQIVLLAPKSGMLDMPIATGRKLENYRFEVLGEEVLAFPSGERRALRVRTRSGGDTIELWLRTGDAAAARGLPLKIRFTDRKGEVFDQVADNVDAETK